jgi:uncharacterized repeat protein (TIGR01451 family)
MSHIPRRPRTRHSHIGRVVAVIVATAGLAVVGASPALAHDWELTQPNITVPENVEFSGVVSCIEPTAGGSFNTADFTGTIDWGDGSAPTAATIGGGGFSSPCFIDVSGTHTYAVAGTYDLFVSVRDLTLDGHLTFGYQGTATVTRVPNDLGVGVGATPNPVRTGKNLTYTVSLTNGSGNIASDVTSTFTLPAQTQFVSLSTTAGSCVAPPVRSTGTITCQIGSLSGSAGWSLTATVKVVAQGGSSIAATATVSGVDADPFSANNSATVATAVFGRR